MNKKQQQLHNAQISQLFDDYAQSLPSEQLSQKAHEQLVAQKTSASRPRTFGVFRWMGAVAACLVVALILFVVVPLSFSQNIGNSDNNSSTPSMSEVSVYSAESVYCKALTTVSETFCPARLKDDYNITHTEFYAYYFKDTNILAYVKGLIGVETEYGVVEISFVAETEQYVQSDRRETYQKFIDNSVQPYLNGGNANNGEYVTESYFAANGYNFYVNALCNSLNEEEAQKIIKYFFEDRDKS